MCRLWRNQQFFHKFIGKEARGDRGCNLDCIKHASQTMVDGNITNHNARRLGHSPRYNPITPSVRSILLSASMAPLYLYPNTPDFMPATCIFRLSTSNGYVKVWDIDPVWTCQTPQLFGPETNPPANAPQLSFLGIVLLPGGVIIPLRNSYVAKLMPT